MSLENTVHLSRLTSFEVIVQNYVERILRGSMTPSMGSSTFSRVKSPQLLDPRKTWYVLSNGVCCERAPKYFSKE